MTRRKLLCSLAVLVSLASSPILIGQSSEVIDNRDIKLISFVDLQYPPVAKSARVQGVVVVRLELDAAGNVREARPLSGPEPLIEPALQNARQWKYQSNARGAVILVYDFTLETGVCHDDTHSLFMLKHQNLATISACAPVLRG